MASTQAERPVVLAGGGVVRRVIDGRLVIAVVRRDRHQRSECSLPKGKLATIDDDPEAAATREVLEETGCRAVVRDMAGIVSYPVGQSLKVVLFWTMDVAALGPVSDSDEIRSVEWLEPLVAVGQLTFPEQKIFLNDVIERGLLPSPRRGWKAAVRARRSDPQIRRLREEIDDIAGDLHAIGRAGSAEVAARMLDHVNRARRAAEIGDPDTGWGQAYRARECQILEFSHGDVVRTAVEVDSEAQASGKFNAWRRAAITRLLAPILTTEPAQAAESLDEQRRALRQAVRVRNEGFANDYRRLTILRRHQRRLLTIGALGLAIVVGLVVWQQAELDQAPTSQWWVMIAALSMGVVGAATSAAQRSAHLTDSRIPERLSSHVASVSRVPIGAVAGLLVWLGAHTGAAPAENGAAYVLVAAFGAGFAERLVAPAAEKG